ncbi:hypothetical protein [Hymenobacter sp. BT491]|uniref:hypothetical protein n=1 Tax=Hymenobacter sp. BT491 TaxID=2766779 RepID=UPI001653C773|nr:hypothetical protein [Hymenobacter sp. BT491]MBC6992192.1 hypothetical protein [Hymenobacter sp. BT491]
MRTATTVVSARSESAAGSLQAQVIRVRITGVQGDTYTYWSEAGGLIFTGRMQRLQ